MSAPTLKRYRVLFRQESHYKVEVPATSEEHAITFVEEALEDGLDLDAIPYGGEHEVVTADEIEEEGAP